MRALQRVIAILEAVGNSRGRCSASQAAAATQIPLSTTARLMHQLADDGLLIKHDETGTYALGPRIFAIAEGGMQQYGLREVARPTLEMLRDNTGETAALHVRAGSHRVCVDQVASHHAIGRLLRVGDVNPLVGSATGEVLLAGIPAREQVPIVEAAGLSDRERKELTASLEDIRARGYAFSENRWAPGVASVAVPIWRDGVTIASLNISGPTHRFARAEAEAALPDLLKAAEAIARLV